MARKPWSPSDHPRPLVPPFSGAVLPGMEAAMVVEAARRSAVDQGFGETSARDWRLVAGGTRDEVSGVASDEERVA